MRDNAIRAAVLENMLILLLKNAKSALVAARNAEDLLPRIVFLVNRAELLMMEIVLLGVRLINLKIEAFVNGAIQAARPVLDLHLWIALIAKMGTYYI